MEASTREEEYQRTLTQCLYEIEPASASKCSISFPVRIPPCALVYWSRKDGSDANGRSSWEYDSCIRRGGSWSAAAASSSPRMLGDDDRPRSCAEWRVSDHKDGDRTDDMNDEAEPLRHDPSLILVSRASNRSTSTCSRDEEDAWVVGEPSSSSRKARHDDGEKRRANGASGGGR